DIKRGRDNGLAGYIKYRKFCFDEDITTWEELKGNANSGSPSIPDKIIENFKLLYKSVEDVDLYTAGISETPKGGAIVGPTFACMIGEMFRRIKFGDRFYVGHGGQTGSFKQGMP